MLKQEAEKRWQSIKASLVAAKKAKELIEKRKWLGNGRRRGGAKAKASRDRRLGSVEKLAVLEANAEILLAKRKKEMVVWIRKLEEKKKAKSSAASSSEDAGQSGASAGGGVGVSSEDATGMEIVNKSQIVAVAVVSEPFLEASFQAPPPTVPPGSLKHAPNFRSKRHAESSTIWINARDCRGLHFKPGSDGAPPGSCKDPDRKFAVKTFWTKLTTPAGQFIVKKKVPLTEDSHPLAEVTITRALDGRCDLHFVRDMPFGLAKEGAAAKIVKTNAKPKAKAKKAKGCSKKIAKVPRQVDPSLRTLQGCDPGGNIFLATYNPSSKTCTFFGKGLGKQLVKFGKRKLRLMKKRRILSDELKKYSPRVTAGENERARDPRAGARPRKAFFGDRHPHQELHKTKSQFNKVFKRIIRAQRKLAEYKRQARNTVAAILISAADTTLLPHVPVHQWVRKFDSPLSPQVKSQILALGHCRFRDYFLHRSLIFNKEVFIVKEHYTSKSCPQCHLLNDGAFVVVPMSFFGWVSLTRYRPLPSSQNDDSLHPPPHKNRSWLFEEISVPQP